MNSALLDIAAYAQFLHLKNDLLSKKTECGRSK